MADAPVAKPKKKGGKGGMIVMAVGALALAGGGAAGGFFFAGKASANAEPKKAEKKPAQVKYFEIDKGFTSNLREPERYVEISVGVSTKTEEGLGESLKANDIAIRSTVLGLLADQSADEISTLAGKQALQGRLKLAINQTLKGKTGKAGIDDVYFTNFIVQ